MALMEAIFQSILGRKGIQISNCNSSCLPNPLQPVCSNTLVQESPGVMDRDRAGKDDPRKAGKGDWGGSWCSIPLSPSSIFAILGDPKEGCLMSLMLGQGCQAQGGIFGVILGRDRSCTLMILVVPSQLRRFCDSMILMYSFNFLPEPNRSILGALFSLPKSYVFSLLPR